MPLFSPKKRKDKRKATEEPSDGRGNPGKKQETSRKSGGPCVVVRGDSKLAHCSAKGKLPVVMATALGADVVTATALGGDIPKPSLPSNTEEFMKVVEESLEQAKIEDAGAGESYASKASKTKVDHYYPFALYICAGWEDRANLSKSHYCAFEDHVISTKIKNISNVDAKKEDLRIDFMLYCKNSFGLAACTSRNSAEFVKALASKFVFEGIKTRAYARWEQEEAWIYSLFLTGEFWKNNKPNYSLGLILKHNDISGQFRNVMVDKSSNKNGIFLLFEPISEKFINQLNSREKLDCMICSSLLKKRLRKIRSEEFFLSAVKEK